MWPLCHRRGPTASLPKSLEPPLSSLPLNYNEQREKLISLRQVALGIQAARVRNCRVGETTGYEEVCRARNGGQCGDVLFIYLQSWDRSPMTDRQRRTCSSVYRQFERVLTNKKTNKQKKNRALDRLPREETETDRRTERQTCKQA